MATMPNRLRYAARRMMALYVAGALVMIAVAGLAALATCLLP